MTHIELLAPAKDLDCGLAAINCGADAVYIGAARFGARENAGNPLADIETLTRHAHTYWAKVYVTVNTLLRDEELPQAVRLIQQLYEMGVDGLIIQDVGLLEGDLPPLPLIASTQMHNNTPERVGFLEQVGFQRAILARELELEQIAAIRRATSLELECFIHGALCVGYSGQCYLSYALGGRSGNRGQCAQPCRKRYSLVDAAGNTLVRDRHLLSLRDLNLSAHLEELIRAGVCSFKIEGRLKEQAYVMNVVSFYRARLDAVLAGHGLRKSSSGSSVIDFTPDPAKTFNRGASSYFLHGRGDKVGAPETPKMVGELLGPVATVTPRSFTLETDVPIHNGDGFCYFDSDGELRGTVVRVVHGRTIIPEKLDGLARGILIYRNHDHAFLTHLAKSQPERQIAVDFTVRDTPDGIQVTVVDEDGTRADISLPCEKVLAEKPEQAMSSICKQLQKTGGTEFRCRDVAVELSAPYFLPVSVLNAARREALAQLGAARATQRPVMRGGAVRNAAPFPEKTLSYLGNVLNQQAANFYRRHGVTAIDHAAEMGVDLHGQRVMTTRYCLKHQFDRCPQQGATARSREPLALVDEDGNRLELRFDCARCGMDIYLGARRPGNGRP